jgi:Lipocalin-like
VSEVRERGFISNTLGQGVTGTIRGSWTINGKTIILNIASAENERVANRSTTSVIETFTPNELIVKSDRGDTSKFRRAF